MYLQCGTLLDRKAISELFFINFLVFNHDMNISQSNEFTSCSDWFHLNAFFVKHWFWTNFQEIVTLDTSIEYIKKWQKSAKYICE